VVAVGLSLLLLGAIVVAGRVVHAGLGVSVFQRPTASAVGLSSAPGGIGLLAGVTYVSCRVEGVVVCTLGDNSVLVGPAKG
jgi:hypothetical protein